MTRSATRLEVSTLPATTAAGAGGVRRQAGGGSDLDRAVGAGAGGRVGVGEDADGEEGGGFRHRERAVEVAVDLRVGAGEVEVEGLAGARRGDAEGDVALGAVRGVAFEEVLGGVGAVRERGQRGAGAAL